MRKVFRVILFMGAFFIGYSVSAVLFFKFAPVPVTPLMVIRCAQQLTGGKHLKLENEWVSRRKISDNMRLAVICSEDQNFVNHHGFDLEAIDKAVKESQSGRRRL